MIHCLKIRMISIFHTFMQGNEFTVTQILFCERPLPKFGKQMWKREKGGREERWTVRLAARKGLVQHAPFSHYTSVSVCLRVFYTEEPDADIIPRNETCLCIFGPTIERFKVFFNLFFCRRTKVGEKIICLVHTKTHTKGRREVSHRFVTAVLRNVGEGLL